MDKYLQKIEQQLDEMEQKIPFLSSIDLAVSKVPVGWHLAHNLKVINTVISGLEYSEPANYQKSFSWKKELVFLLKKIPRGKARSPKKVIPSADISAVELRKEIASTGRRVLKIKDLQKKAFFEHPYFGHISRDETPKFLFIHTEHHLKIIRDILK